MGNVAETSAEALGLVSPRRQSRLTWHFRDPVWYGQPRKRDRAGIGATDSASFVLSTEQLDSREWVSMNEPKVVVPETVKFPSQDFFVALEKWEGKVISISDDQFVAEVVTLAAGPWSKDLLRKTEFAEFSMTEVSPGQRELLQPGAIFYWSIGYRDQPSGQRTNES